jgi:hypothetical protein
MRRMSCRHDFRPLVARIAELEQWVQHSPEVSADWGSRAMRPEAPLQRMAATVESTCPDVTWAVGSPRSGEAHYEESGHLGTTGALDRKRLNGPPGVASAVRAIGSSWWWSGRQTDTGALTVEREHATRYRGTVPSELTDRLTAALRHRDEVLGLQVQQGASLKPAGGRLWAARHRGGLRCLPACHRRRLHGPVQGRTTAT